MNTKDVLMLVNRKYKMIKEEAVKEIDNRIKELEDEKAEIEKEIEKERISLVDEIIVLGIKDELVKEKIKSLLEIK